MDKSEKGVMHFVAGGLGGGAEILCTMPLDTVKTQMQLYPKKYSNFIQAIYRISRTSSLFQLYYGLGPMLIQVSSKAAIRFTAFAQYKKFIEQFQKKTDIKMSVGTGNFACGLLAGCTEALVWTTPTERLKVLQQDQVGRISQGGKHGMISTISKLVKTGGIKSLYRGVFPTALRQGSSVGVRFMLYHHVKDYLGVSDNSSTPAAAWKTIVAGGFCGFVSVFVNNPVDVVKSRMQAEVATNIKGSKMMYQSSWQCFLHVLKTGGVSHLWKGSVVRATRVGMGQAITFSVYEKVMQYFKNE